MTVTGQGTGQGAGRDAERDAERDTGAARALRGLADERSSVRLSAALAVGSAPEARSVEALVERCAVEPEFFVRDMLTWALTRHPVSLTLPALLREVRSGGTQARSQALHTLSKIGDRRAWPALTRELLCDAEDEVARSAWRAAVVLVPEGEEAALATVLATQLGRGGRETQLSLSRALVALGEVTEPVLRAAAGRTRAAGAHEDGRPEARPCPDAGAHAHALATLRLLRDPDTGFAFAIEEAKRVVALGNPGGEEA